jgi:hypothetical protein
MESLPSFAWLFVAARAPGIPRDVAENTLTPPGTTGETNGHGVPRPRELVLR